MSFIDEIPESSHFPKGPLATLDDVWNCYRLLLNREPDAGGFETHAAIVRNGASVDELWRLFVASPEYAGRVASLTDPTVARTSLEGFDLFVPKADAVGGQILTNGTYEPHVTEAIRAALRPGQLFLDIGANVGYFTILAAKAVGPSGQVIALEPLARNVKLLLANARTNAADNVLILPFGASDSDGFITLLATGSTASSRETQLEDLTSASALEIAYSLTVDSVAPEDRPIDIVKIDSHGFDHRAMVGAQESLQRSHPQVFAKFAPGPLAEFSQIDPIEYLRLFQAAGYNDFNVLRREGPPLSAQNDIDLIARLPAEEGVAHLDLHIRRV